MNCDIPDIDKPDFSKLPESVRKEVNLWLDAMPELLAACGRGIGEAIMLTARKMNVSQQTVRRKYDLFRKSGNWRVFINHAKAADTRRDNILPPLFVAYWRRLCEENQRKCRPAYRKLIRIWRTAQAAGEAFPGYDACPPETTCGHPKGWSYDNLMRYASTKFELVAIRQGLGSAMAQHGPKVLSTRVGLWPGAFIQVDDLTRDFKVMLVGKNSTARIQELGWLDVYSGSRFLVHRRPQWEENGKKNSLKEAEMRFTVAAFARNVGYSPRGTTILSEHGTAAIRAALQEFLFTHSNGLLKVRESGMTGKVQAITGWRGRGGGNPRHKAHLESLHNLLHNESADLPAQVGHDRNYPEWLFGLEAITDDVRKWIVSLPPERAGLLITPMCEYWQALGLLADIDRRIDWRTDHNLEGWEKCGHRITEFRRDPHSDIWIPPHEFLTLPETDRTLIKFAAEASPMFRRTRKMAPAEVFGPAMEGFIRFPDHVIALMFCDDRLGVDLRSEPKRLGNDGRFHVSNQTADPEPLVFEGTVTTPHGELIRLEERTGYRTVLNPFDPSALWIYDQRGGFVGTAALVERFCQIDDAGLRRALGNRARETAALLTPLRDRHAGAAAEIRQLQEHNDRVTGGQPVTEAEIEAAKPLPKSKAVKLDEFAELGGDSITWMEPEPCDQRGASLEDILSL